jgi:hypothetical protein
LLGKLSDVRGEGRFLMGRVVRRNRGKKRVEGLSAAPV